MAFGDTVNVARGTGSSGEASVTFTSASAGNLLIFAVARASAIGVGGSWGTISGWTNLPNTPVNSGNVAGAAWYKIADGGETSVTTASTGEAGNWTASVSEYSGPFSASPLDASGDDESKLTTTTNSCSSGSMQTTQASDLAIAWFAIDSPGPVSSGCSVDNGFSIVVESLTSPRATSYVAKRVLTTAGSYATTLSYTGTAEEMYGGIAAFKEASSGSPPTVVLNTSASTVFSSASPTLEFTGTDSDGDDISYEIQISNSIDFLGGSHVGDSYDTATNITSVHANPVFAVKTWEGFQQVDDRLGQSFWFGGGYLDSVDIYMTRDDVATAGSALVRIYDHQGVFGSGCPLNPVSASNTPTSGCLAISDKRYFDTSMAASSMYYTFDFTGDNRVLLEGNKPYFFIADWQPHSVSGSEAPYENNVVFRASTNLGADGNAYIDGYEPANWGIRTDFDFLFKVYEDSFVYDKLSDTAGSGFSNVLTPSDTDPFTSGCKVSYTIQAGSGLMNGVYFWRVRAKDPSGTNSYGDWSDIRNFTVNVSDANTVSGNVSFYGVNGATLYSMSLIPSGISISGDMSSFVSSLSSIQSLFNAYSLSGMTFSPMVAIPNVFLISGESMLSLSGLANRIANVSLFGRGDIVPQAIASILANAILQGRADNELLSSVSIKSMLNLYGNSDTNIYGLNTMDGTLGLDGRVSLLTSAIMAMQSLANFTGIGSQINNPILAIPSNLDLYGLLSLIASGTVVSGSGQGGAIVSGSTVFAGQANLFLSALNAIQADIEQIMSGNLSLTSDLEVRAFTNLSGLGLLISSGLLNISDETVMAGQADLILSALNTINGEIDNVLRGDLSGVSNVTINALAGLSGLAYLIASGIVTSGEGVQGLVSFYGRSDLILYALNAINSQIEYILAGSVDFVPKLTINSFSNLSGLGFLIASGLIPTEGQAILAGRGDLILSALNIINNNFIADGESILSAQSLVSVLSNAIISGTGNIQAYSSLLIDAISVLYGAGVLTPVGTIPVAIVTTTPLARTFVVAQENRVYVIDHEGRIFIING